MEKIWLSSNQFHCDCDMTWMIGCLNNLTNHWNKKIIVDYQEVKCHSGMMMGKQIYRWLMGLSTEMNIPERANGLGLNSAFCLFLLEIL